MRTYPRWCDVTGHVSFKIYDLANAEIDRKTVDMAVNNVLADVYRLVPDKSGVEVTEDFSEDTATVTVTVNTYYDANVDCDWVDEDLLRAVPCDVCSLLSGWAMISGEGDYDFDYVDFSYDWYEE